MRRRTCLTLTAPYRRSTNITGRADHRPKHPEKVFHRPACLEQRELGRGVGRGRTGSGYGHAAVLGDL